MESLSHSSSMRSAPSGEPQPLTARRDERVRRTRSFKDRASWHPRASAPQADIFYGDMPCPSSTVVSNGPIP